MNIKRIYFIVLPAVLSAVGLTGCVHEEMVEPVGDGEGRPVTVSAGLGDVTRAFGSYWEKGDAIGVFAVNSDNNNTMYSNKKFVSGISTGYASETSTFSAATNTGVDENIYFSNLSEWTFSAYYPYNADASGTGKIDIDLTQDCTSKNLDIMYASGAKAKHTAYSSENPVVYFDGSGETGHGTKFRHMMSRFIIRVHLGAGVSDEDILGSTCKLGPLKALGTFEISTGKIEITDLSLAGRILTLVDAGTGKAGVSFGEKIGDYYQLSTLYLLPCDLYNVFKFSMRLPGWSEDKDITPYIWRDGLESGKSYELDLTVNHSSLELTGCTVSDWDDQPEQEMGIDNAGYGSTQVGDIMYEDGYTSPTAVTNHGRAVGIVAALYNDQATLTEGVGEALEAKGVTPHGLVLSLQENPSVAWDSKYSNTQINTGISCYSEASDGITFQNLPVGDTGKTVLELARDEDGFEAFKWCDDLNQSVSSYWIANNTTGWYMPGAREWIDMMVSWAYAAVDHDTAGNIADLLHYGYMNMTGLSRDDGTREVTFPSNAITGFVNASITGVSDDATMLSTSAPYWIAGQTTSNMSVGKGNTVWVAYLGSRAVTCMYRMKTQTLAVRAVFAF